MSSKIHKPKPGKTWNRSIPDSILLCHSTANALKKAESLSPTLSTMERALAGEESARAILSSWSFSVPVVTVTVGGVV